MWKYYLALVAAWWLFFNTYFLDAVVGLAGGGGSATFLRGFLAESWRLRKPLEIRSI